MTQEPISILQSLYQHQEPIRLLNVYKGLPISNEATITAINGSVITVTSVQSQIVCMYLDRETHIQSAYLPLILSAKVVELLPTKMEVRLTNLLAVRGSIGNRQHVRVEPSEAMNGLLQPKNTRHTIPAELADISQKGVAIYIPTRFFSSDTFRVGTEMTIHLTLPEAQKNTVQKVYNPPTQSDPMGRFSREQLRSRMDSAPFQGTSSENDRQHQNLASITQISVQAVVKNLKPEIPSGRVRIGMMISADAPAHAALNNFISQRQADIIKEIKTLHDLLTRSR